MKIEGWERRPRAPRAAPMPDMWELIDRETGRVVRTFSTGSAMGRHIASGRVCVPHGLLAHNLRTGEVIY